MVYPGDVKELHERLTQKLAVEEIHIPPGSEFIDQVYLERAGANGRGKFPVLSHLPGFRRCLAQKRNPVLPRAVASTKQQWKMRK